MPNIVATLKVNEQKDWIYWIGKPANRYELTYYSEISNKPETLYNASLSMLFRNFFLKNGTFNSIYSLNIPASLKGEERTKIEHKFNAEKDHFVRRLLGLGSNASLPEGAALETALDTAFEKRKNSLRKELQAERNFIRIQRNIWSALSTSLLVSLAVIGIIAATGGFALPATPVLLAIGLGAFLFCSTLGWGACFATHRSLKTDIQKVDTLSNPFSLTKYDRDMGPTARMSPQLSKPIPSEPNLAPTPEEANQNKSPSQKR